MSKYRIKKSLASLLRLFTGKRVIKRRLPVCFGGGKILVSPSVDIRVLSRNLDYAYGDLFQVVAQFIKPGDIVWDMGANLGAFTFASAYCAGTEGHVYAVEADTRHAQLMYESKAGLGERFDNITILCAAVSDEMACLDLNIVDRGNAKNFISKSMGNEEAGRVINTKSVVSITADWLLQYWKPPDFLKVDIEGAELLFLKGAGQLLRDTKPAIYIEVDKENQTEVTDLLKAYGYEIFSLGSKEGEALTKIDRCAVNTVCIHKDVRR